MTSRLTVRIDGTYTVQILDSSSVSMWT